MLFRSETITSEIDGTTTPYNIIQDDGTISYLKPISFGSGYTSAPQVIFAKKYEIVKEKYPVYIYNQLLIDTRLNDGVALPVEPYFNVGPISLSERYDSPYIITSLTTNTERKVIVEDQSNKDVSRPSLAYVLQTFDQNKFKYEPLNLNDPLSSYLGTNVNIQNVSRYAPNLTIGDFTSKSLYMG